MFLFNGIALNVYLSHCRLVDVQVVHSAKLAGHFWLPAAGRTRNITWVYSLKLFEAYPNFHDYFFSKKRSRNLLFLFLCMIETCLVKLAQNNHNGIGFAAWRWKINRFLCVINSSSLTISHGELLFPIPLFG